MPTKICIHCDKPISYIKEIDGHACFNDQCDVYCNIIDATKEKPW